MRRSKEQNRFVIFVHPEQHGHPGTTYYTREATISRYKLQAAKFLSFQEAEEFAKLNNIELSAATHIGSETFSEFDL
jgi:hypothetical protein